MTEKELSDYKLKISKDWVKTKKKLIKQIFDLLDHEIYRAEYKNKKLMIEFTDYEKIKAKFLQEGAKP